MDDNLAGHQTPACSQRPIFRYELRILLPSLPMRAAGPWFLESSYRTLPEAEARYASLLLLAQAERGSVELVDVRASGHGTRTDLRTVLAWSYRSDQGAFGMRAWPMDAASRQAIEVKVAGLMQRASAGEPLSDLVHPPCGGPNNRLREALSALPHRNPWRLLSVGAAACFLLACAFHLGCASAKSDITAAMAGIVTPRWCYELDADREPSRIWTEYPQMKFSELKDARRLRGIEGLQGSTLQKSLAEREMRRLNYLVEVK